MDEEYIEDPSTAFVASVAMIRHSLNDLQEFLGSLPAPDDLGVVHGVNSGTIARMDTIRHYLKSALLKAEEVARCLED